MGIREERQAEAAQAYLESVDRRSIINACPRFGKIRVAIDIIRSMKAKNIMIFMPRNDIKKGWEDDFIKYSCTVNVRFCTFISIKKAGPFALDEFDLVIIDEPHELSKNQQVALSGVVRAFPTLGLTGTLTQKTRIELYDNLNLDVCYKYTIDEGVMEGILTDYDIIIHRVPLEYKEADRFRRMEFAKAKADTALSAHFINLKMINLIQNSIGKMEKTKKLIKASEGERILVFCGTTEISDQLGISVYHSKAKEQQVFDDFCRGVNINQLATIKMMQAGITVTPINKGIINYMSGNPEDSAQKICRFLGLEYANPNKKAEIHIISSDEKFETDRLRTGLAFFDQSKIKEIN